MPAASKTSFIGLWGRHDKGKGFAFSKAIEDEINGGNRPLIALFNIFQDISKHESLGDGYMGAKKQFRDASTHRFTVLHDMGNDHSSKTSAIDHKSLVEFERLTLDALKLARAALFYFVDFILFAEQHKEDEQGGIVLSSEVPDHDFIRGRKG